MNIENIILGGGVNKELVCEFLTGQLAVLTSTEAETDRLINLAQKTHENLKWRDSSGLLHTLPSWGQIGTFPTTGLCIVLNTVSIGPNPNRSLCPTVCYYRALFPVAPTAEAPAPPATDEVNRPAHYTSGKIEVIDFIEDQKLGYHLGNVVKYVARAGKKDPSKRKQDLEKAAWYLNREIQNIK